MRHLPPVSDANVLVGYGTADDAGVYKISDDLALVQTVDFFTPIVDDPYDFGRIAAANALSDVYAMGATPITALNIVAYPFEELGPEVLHRILAGGSAIAQQAHVAIIGGHTIKDSEPKFGMSVLGTLHPGRIVTNAGARPGDILALTKPLGTGVLATALKRGRLTQTAIEPAVAWMTELNDRASRAMLAVGAHAATDITGFGLLGHANEIAQASHVAMHIDSSRVPLMNSITQLISEGIVPGGSVENAQAHARFTSFRASVPEAVRTALSDAQTSGGLLIALPRDRAEDFQQAMGTGFFALIGDVREGSGIKVE